MANTIQIKRSSTASDTPSASDLAVGELAVNTADAKLFTKHSDGSVVEIAAGGGGSSDSFKTIAVSGQSNVVAESSTDTLTLVAGSNMTITTDASTDTITLASSGGGGGGITTGKAIAMAMIFG